MHAHLASLQRQRCQLHRELQELCHELPAASPAAPEPLAGAAVGIAADVFRSPRRRLAPPPPRLAARVAALDSLQSELMVACDAFATEMDAANVPAGTHLCLESWAGVLQSHDTPSSATTCPAITSLRPLPASRSRHAVRLPVGWMLPTGALLFTETYASLFLYVCLQLLQ